MDDGAEGYMSPHLTRDGLPVCKRGNTCGVLSSDQFFATDKYAISTAGRARLMEFFRSANARAFSISGHTDSRTSDAYKMHITCVYLKTVRTLLHASLAKLA